MQRVCTPRKNSRRDINLAVTYLVMNNDEYIQGVLRTKSKHFDNEAVPADLLHAIMGVVTESGELMDVCKRAFYYGKGKEAVDLVNIKEEFGDILWYVALGLHACGSSFEEVMQTNLDKLKARYPEKFSLEDAYERDLSKERSVLEQ